MILPPFDAWVLANLMAMQPTADDELARMTDPWRALAQSLAAATEDNRQPVLNGFLAGQPDPDQIIEVLAAADPNGLAPPLDATASSDEWPPLRLDELPCVEPFPTDVLPPMAAQLVIEGASAIGCAPDFLGLAMLAVAGGTIGRSLSLLLKPNYFVGATLYVGCIGPPSDGKTPALKVAAAPVRFIDDELAGEHAVAMEQWRASQIGPEGKPTKTKPPPAPRPRRIDIDDATMEVLPLILCDNPRGLIMIRDELTAFILGMNQFKGGKGNDRSNALKIWSGDRIIKDRVNHENNAPVRCAHPALSIVGGLTPDMLGELTDPKGRADGFIDRFLLAFPDPRPVPDWTDRGIPEVLIDDWSALIARLWLRPLDVKEDREVPHVMRFTPEGKARWHQRYDEHSAEMNATDFPPFLRGPWGKFREYAGRLTLILTALHHAADLAVDALAVPEVGPRLVDSAWRLIRYFKSHAKRIRAVIASGPGTGETRAVKNIVEWIRSNRLLVFTESDIKQARRWIDDDDLRDALDFLSKRNAIRARQAPTAKAKGGRPPSPAYDVNPELLPTANP